MTIKLAIELTNANDGRGHAFWRSAKRRKEIEEYLRLAFPKMRLPTPCGLTVVRVLGKGQRLWDYDSGLRGNWKEIQDSMVACGWMPDDGPQHLTRCDFRQDATRRGDGPCVEIEVD